MSTLMDLYDVINNNDLQGLRRTLQWISRYHLSRALELAMRTNFHEAIPVVLEKLDHTHDPHEQRKILENVMVLSAQCSDLKSIKMLADHCPGSRDCWTDSLTQALEHGNVEVAQFIYDEKSSPSLPLPTKVGLHRAIQKNHNDVVRWGIQRNVDMDVVEMAIANRNQNSDMADLLYDHATPAQREEAAIILIDRELTPENSRWLYRHHVQALHDDLTQNLDDHIPAAPSARKKI